MSVSIGTQLGQYEITALLGKGGMGEVYRARDLRLKRDVAIKTIPDEFSRDLDRITRFQREAEALAALNHANIGTIYDFQISHDVPYLVLELVEGDTLADILKKRGALPVDDALAMAKQITEALESAHEKGIVHRDLKPANIKITPEGNVKLLDFGLARIFENPSTVDLSNSPTVMSRSTPGVILGTVSYMSPEQARGRPVDRRTDIWAFGCVLYEMLTGRKAYAGDDASEIIAAVIRGAPEWKALPPNAGPRLRELLRRCMQKDPRQRFQHIGDARLELEVGNTGEPAFYANPSSTRREHIAWIAAALAITATIAIGLVSRLRPPASPGPQMRLTVPLEGLWDFAISPDSRQMAYIDKAKASFAVWVKPLASETAIKLDGTEGALSVFWSGDSRSIGFVTHRQLKRVNVEGGSPQTLCELGALGGGTSASIGASWNRNGVILFGAGAGPLYKVAATGGALTPATELDSSRNEISHLMPQFLPDGRRFIYLAQTRDSGHNGVYVGSLDGGPTRLLLSTNLRALFWHPGSLLFVRENVLVAQQMDLQTLQLQGEAIPVATGVDSFAAYGMVAMSVSDTGALVYVKRKDVWPDTELIWVDRSGRTTSRIGDPGGIRLLRLSPNEKWLATVRSDGQSNAAEDIWLTELSTNITSRFSKEPSGEFDPAWAPDSDRLAFSSDRLGHMALFQKSRIDGKDKQLMDSADSIFMCDWSRDGKFILYHQAGRKIYAARADGEGKPIVVVDSTFMKDQAQFSPDTKWVAYNANDGGRFDIYVTSFPTGSQTKQISLRGGVQPRWRADGKELFYVNPEGQMMAVDVRPGPHIEFGTPHALFQTRIIEPDAGTDLYDVARDGQQFIMIVPVGNTTSVPVNILLNWRPSGN